MSLMRKPPTQNFGQEPRRSKLVNFLRTVREEKYDPPNVSAREIQEWCEAHKGPPADDDEPYVLDGLRCCRRDTCTIGTVLRSCPRNTSINFATFIRRS